MIKAVGPKISFPISPAVVAGNIFFATNVPVDLQSGHFVGGPIETQARQVFGNLEALLKEAGGSLSDVAQLTIYLTDAKDVAGMNKVYAEFFAKEPHPSRATMVVNELIGPPGIRIETTAQAYLLSS
jgi:2-iminobutanoate/2-iminopropanoate deaminase